MKTILILLLTPCLLPAQPQQSEAFHITKSVLDCGGGLSSSQDFRLTSSFGQPSPLGWQSSTDFNLSAGFLSPNFAVSPLSPIQQLVIQQLNPDVRLAWPPVIGAAQYRIYRSTDPLLAPADINYLGTTTDTSFTDSNIAALPAVGNYYIVTALSGSGALLTNKRQANGVAGAAGKAPSLISR